MGFPSKIQDDPIIDLLLDNSEKAILLTVKNKESEFIKELKNKYADELKKEQFTCPLCDGSLRRKNGPYGELFWLLIAWVPGIITEAKVIVVLR